MSCPYGSCESYVLSFRPFCSFQKSENLIWKKMPSSCLYDLRIATLFDVLVQVLKEIWSVCRLISPFGQFLGQGKHFECEFLEFVIPMATDSARTSTLRESSNWRP